MSAESPGPAVTIVEGKYQTDDRLGPPTIPGYEFLELVGRGGMGKVYRARQIDLNRTVAVKLLLHEPEEKLLARFREETRAVAKLQHPNIAQLFESGTIDGSPFYSQEFVDGGTLAQKFAGKPQDPVFAAEIVSTVARAIQHSHDHGILHRDLKPSNILLASDGTPKVTDFGLAKSFLPSDPSASTVPDALTRTGEIVGTPSYMPPEQASGVTARLGPAADIYSLGAILYEALTGRPPFQAPEPIQTLLMVLTMEPVSPRALLPKLPRDIETICLKCLEKSPRRRYGSAAELAEELDRFRRGEPILARPVSWLERTGKWARRRKAAAALIGVVFLFAVAIGVFTTVVTLNGLKLKKANELLEANNRELERLNGDLETSRGETEKMLGLALSSMDEYHFSLSERLKDLPGGEKLRVEVLDQARATLDKIFAAGPQREAVWEYLMSGYHQLGNSLQQIGDSAGAERAYSRSAEAALQLSTSHSGEVRHRAARGMLLLQRANVLDTLGQTDRATEIRREGLKLAVELDGTHPNNPQVIQLNLIATPHAFEAAIRSGKIESYVPLYQRWAALYYRLAAADPNEQKHLMKAVEQELTLVGLFAQLERFSDAQELLARSKVTLDALPETKAPASRLLRASYHEAVGSVASARNEVTAADAAYRKALAEYETLSKEFPSSPNYRRNLVNIWSKIGNLWAFSDRPSEGLIGLRKARAHAASLVEDFPANQAYKESLDFLDRRIATMAQTEKK